MPCVRLLCTVLTIALLAAGCSQSPTSPSALASDPVPTVAAPPPTATSNAPATLIVPPGAIGISRMVAFGDSITWGAMSAFDANYLYAAANGGYVERLEANLNLLHPPQRFSVFNDGQPGELAISALTRFRTMLTTRRPEGVLLLEGINDLSNSISAGTTANAIRQMLDAAAQVGVPVALATMYPTYGVVDPDGNYRDNGSAVVPVFNNELRRIVAGRPNVLLVDLEPLMRERRFVGGDGIHLEDAGFDVVAGAFMRAIESAYPVRGSFQ